MGQVALFRRARRRRGGLVPPGLAGAAGEPVREAVVVGRCGGADLCRPGGVRRTRTSGVVPRPGGGAFRADHPSVRRQCGPVELLHVRLHHATEVVPSRRAHDGGDGAGRLHAAEGGGGVGYPPLPVPDHMLRITGLHHREPLSAAAREGLLVRGTAIPHPLLSRPAQPDDQFLGGAHDGTDGPERERLEPGARRDLRTAHVAPSAAPPHGGRLQCQLGQQGFPRHPVDRTDGRRGGAR